MALEVGGKSIALDEEGYLENLGDWTPEIAEALAKGEDVTLTSEHWEVLNFLREYYEEYQIAPAVRVLTKAIGKQLGADKGNNKYLYSCSHTAPASRHVNMLACLSRLVACNLQPWVVAEIFRGELRFERSLFNRSGWVCNGSRLIQ